MVVKLSLLQISQVFFGHFQAKITKFLDVIDMIHALELDDIKVLGLAVAGNFHVHDKLVFLIEKSQFIAFFKTLFRKICH